MQQADLIENKTLPQRIPQSYEALMVDNVQQSVTEHDYLWR